jgi:tetratricopeptide (TPR) repeat protein
MRKIKMLPTAVNSHRCHCLFLAVILLVAPASLAQAQTSRFAAVYYNRGNERYKKGDLDGAIADYDAALTFDPRWALAYNMRGSARYNKGDLDGSIADYELAIKSDPFFAKAYGNRGLARLFQGDMARAEKDFDQCLRLDPKLKSLLEEEIEKAKRGLAARQ